MGHVSRLAKVRAMSIPEIATRLQYQGQTTLERRLHRSGRLAPTDRLREALVRDIRRSSDWQDELVHRERAGEFFAGVRASARESFPGAYAGELAQSRTIADRVLRHEIDFFGERFSFGERIDWHADPVSRTAWPREYHLDVPIHGGNRGFGDVKYVWELNRHQFLVDLAKIALLDGSARHHAAVQSLVEDWLRDVPYATGVPWACALEPAFRAWSWMWAYHMLRATGPLEPAFHLSWLTGFYDHARFLHRHLETYSSPYNHLVGEASALFALGLLFPEFDEAPAWVERGRHVLESTLAAQFHADGGTVEQSTFYHHATLGFYLLSGILGRRNHVELSGAIWQAIDRGIAFSMAISQPDGRVPRIGGADDGKPIRLEHLPFFDFRPYQAIGAVIFSRADFKHVAGRFWEDAFWVLGASGADTFAGLSSHPPPRAVALSESGYYVARSGWSSDADYICFDCGPQAAGLRRDDVPSAAHGHADCLSVVAMLGGREVLVDPGFFCYNGEPDWEVHFRKTGAHNTVIVDGRDQARHLSKMAWTRTYAPNIEGWAPDGKLVWMRGSHDGYARGPKPVVHRRTVWLRPGYVLLYDELVGVGPHEFDLIFQFAPGSVERGGPGAVALDGRFELAWGASVPVDTSVATGRETPAGGWISPSLGVKVPAPRLVVRGTMARERVALLSVVSDRARRAAGSRTEVTLDAAQGVLRARVAGAGWEDEVLAAISGPVTAPGIDTDAPLVVLRTAAGHVEEAYQAGGTRIVLAGSRTRPVSPSPAGHAVSVR